VSSPAAVLCVSPELNGPLLPDFFFDFFFFFFVAFSVPSLHIPAAPE
jgi:hypothetical protein